MIKLFGIIRQNELIRHEILKQLGVELFFNQAATQCH